MDNIRNAEMYGLGGVGRAGMFPSSLASFNSPPFIHHITYTHLLSPIGQTSKAEKELVELLKQPNAEDTLQALLKDKNVTPAAQLYALTGLKYKSFSEFQNAVSSLRYYLLPSVS